MTDMKGCEPKTLAVIAAQLIPLGIVLCRHS